MNRTELIQSMGVAAYAQPMPYQPDQEKPGRLRPPTPDEWAAHVLEHAKALGRVVEKEAARLAAEEERRRNEVYARDAPDLSGFDLSTKEGRSLAANSLNEARHRVRSVAYSEHATPDYDTGDGCTQW